MYISECFVSLWGRPYCAVTHVAVLPLEIELCVRWYQVESSSCLQGSILILYCYISLSRVSSQLKCLNAFVVFSKACYMPRPPNLTWCNHLITNYKLWSSSLFKFLRSHGGSRPRLFVGIFMSRCHLEDKEPAALCALTGTPDIYTSKIGDLYSSGYTDVLKVFFAVIVALMWPEVFVAWRCSNNGASGCIIEQRLHLVVRAAYTLKSATPADV